jgi:hypothetical protein
LAGLSDEQLEEQLQRLIRAGAETEAWIVAHLVEVEARGLHLRLGCESIFEYCLEQLKLGDFEAYRRSNAARLARRFPLVLELLEQRARNRSNSR